MLAMLKYTFFYHEEMIKTRKNKKKTLFFIKNQDGRRPAVYCIEIHISQINSGLAGLQLYYDRHSLTT